jgi:hypothetical protein
MANFHLTSADWLLIRIAIVVVDVIAVVLVVWLVGIITSWWRRVAGKTTQRPCPQREAIYRRQGSMSPVLPISNPTVPHPTPR